MKSLSIWLVSATFFLCFGLMGCTNEPNDLLGESVYLDVMTELAFVNELDDAILQEQGLNRAAMMDSVYSKYQITPNQFLISHNYYQRDAQKHSERIEQVEQRIQAERERLQMHVKELEEEQARRERTLTDTTRPKRPAILPNLSPGTPSSNP